MENGRRPERLASEIMLNAVWGLAPKAASTLRKDLNSARRDPASY